MIQSSRNWIVRRPFLTGALLFVCALGTIAVLELTNTTFLFHNRPQLPTAGPATKGQVTKPSHVQAEGSQNSGKTSDTSTTTSDENSIDPSAPLVDPSGTFVSNHHPNLSGSPAPNQIQSVCTTTSGARCTIVFTKGNITKSLPSQLTDSEGTTYWTWKLQDIGLTAGTWKIEARATLGSQVKTASDYMDLEVSE